MIRCDLVATHHRDAAVRDRGSSSSDGGSSPRVPALRIRHFLAAAQRCVIVSHRGQHHLLEDIHTRTALAVAGGLPTLEIASMNSNGRPHSELKKIAVTLTAMAVMAHTG